MNIALGSDHAGLSLKKEIIKYLKKGNYEFTDFGTFTEESCDYPDYAEKVADEVAGGRFTYGILICGTGIGISIAANKIHGIRAALCSDTFSAHASREHNNANILAMGERVVGPGLACDIVDTFLKAEFLGERHERRVNKIMKLEERH